MKDFLYRSSFIRYYVSLAGRNQIDKRRGMWFSLLIPIMPMLTLWFRGFAFIALLALIYGAMLSAYRYNPPNLITLMPLSSRKKTLYQFLSPWLSVALTVIAIFAAAFLITLTIVLLLLILGTVVIDFSDIFWIGDFLKYVYSNTGAIGLLFALIFTVYCYSAGIIYGSMERVKHRAIFLAVWIPLTLVCTRLICVPYSRAIFNEFYETDIFMLIGSPFIKDCYEAMQYPWLCIGLSAVGALVMLGLAILYVLRKDHIARSR